MWFQARPLQGNVPPGPPNQFGGPAGPGGPGGPGFGYYPPPPNMGGWGGRAPPPGPYGNMPYPPPPGWYPPPPGPGGPWGNPAAFPPGPGAPAGPSGAAGPQAPNNRQAPNAQDPRPAPIGAAGDKKPSTPAQQGAGGPTGHSQSQPGQVRNEAVHRASPAQTAAPTLPVDSKPSVAEVKATAASLQAATAPISSAAEANRSVPTGPRTNARPGQIMAAVPLPAALTSKVAQQTQPPANVAYQQATAADLKDATEAAKAAVAVAMARLGQGGSSASIPAPAAHQAGQAVLQNLAKEGGALDNLTKKVGELRVNAGSTRGSPNTRGRGRGGHRNAKVEVPDADFDFAEANAKFNKEEVVKEVASPLHEGAQDGGEATPEVETQAPGMSEAPAAYNKSKSFFDNISSEAKDRAENNGMKPGGREWRGEEQRKNMETFGQGSVDGGYRGGYRGRGRGRGGRGRGYGRGGAARGGNTAYRSNRETQSAA